MTYPTEVRERTIRLVRDGMSYQKAAKQCGATLSTVQSWCRKAGVTSAVPQGYQVQGRPWTDEECSRALAMLKDGASYAEVGRTLGRDHSTVNRKFPGYGWTPEEGARFINHHVRLSQDELLPSKGNYDRVVVFPGVRRLTRVERQELAA